MTDASLPLSGVRICDLGRTYAAPICTQLLADLGADVIKIELPGRGDEMRHYGPPFIQAKDGEDLPLSSYFVGANRNKRSVSVNIATAEGQQIVREIARASDVFVENFKVGDLARKRLDYESIAAINPGIIYCSITGFGQSGPYAGRPGTDSVFQAMSGLMSVTGEPDGPPQRVGCVITDFITGLYAANAIQAALRQREIRGGAGTQIDIALLDATIAAISHRAIDYLIDGAVPQRLGSASTGSAPAQVFPVKDGFINLQASAEPKFRALCEILGQPGIAQDPRFATRAERVRNIDRLVPLLTGLLAEWTLDALYPKLTAAGIVSSPVDRIDQMFANPQVVHRGVRQQMTNADGLVLPMIANPIHFSNIELPMRMPPPNLGEHTTEVLDAIVGMSADRIAELRTKEVI